jgi:hypothetical protein
MSKFFRTVITVEVLGRDEPFTGDLEDLYYATYDGPFSGRVLVHETTEVTPKAMADLLIGQLSDPEFLGIDEDGNDVQDES